MLLLFFSYTNSAKLREDYKTTDYKSQIVLTYKLNIVAAIDKMNKN